MPSPPRQSARGPLASRSRSASESTAASVAGSTPDRAKKRRVRASSTGTDPAPPQILTKEHTCQPVWIGLFPEGTRLIPEQHKRALEFAAENQRAAYKYLLQPRVKGLDSVRERRCSLACPPPCWPDPFSLSA